MISSVDVDEQIVDALSCSNDVFLLLHRIFSCFCVKFIKKVLMALHVSRQLTL